MTTMRDQTWETAAASLGLAVGPRRRPNPLLWIWYAFWGRLPARFAPWVLYDTTSITWVLRHIARIVVAMTVPTLLILFLLPGEMSLRGMTAGITAACALLFTVCWINESTEHRLLQAGYDWGTGEKVRARRSDLS